MTYIPASERSRQIVAAARRVLTEHGVAGTTLRMVAAEAAIPLGTLHYVFPSRERLLRAVLESVTDEFTGLVRNSIHPGMGFAQAVSTSFQAYWRLVEREPMTRAAEFELLLDAVRLTEDADLASWQYGRYVDDAVAAFQSVLDASGESLSTALPDVIRFMIAASDGLVLQFLATGDRRRARDDLENVINAVIAVAKPGPGGGAHGSQHSPAPRSGVAEADGR